MKAITVDQLSKAYRIGLTIKSSLRSTLRQWMRLQALQPTEKLWALKDINFEIGAGQSLGIIGPNGSGKSTLLKLLARVTKPTKGRIEINGSLSAMLEIGAGFHPELTGRENIYLSGSILGMTKTDIKTQLDEIIAFAELERMIDTTVKFYSSGMYVRLAFAIGAFLRSDILLLDEILAVGDAGFQNKCLTLLKDKVHLTGKTILFVSHDLGMVEKLCDKCIHLNEGQLYTMGDTTTVVQNYLANTLRNKTSNSNRVNRKGNGPITIESVSILNKDGKAMISTSSGDRITFSVRLVNNSHKTYHHICLDLGIISPSGQKVSQLGTNLNVRKLECDAYTSLSIDFTIPKLPLMPGLYSLNLSLTHELGLSDWIENFLHFSVAPGGFHITSNLPPSSNAVMLTDHFLTIHKNN